ncbi:unnamed protein product [Paramecium pentaurelia]|uniref:Uncharacterized protein n=1 Tax=Paramecium pentaurelia TaxID=43138 RepID=A0A8S1XJ59_9CILI|nr:unnamed protein product [Paramecium pentaurelia]
MKLVKPPFQIREKQWDNRFYLGKLSDHEIKKQFMIKKKSVKRPTSTNKIVVDEKSLAIRLYELQLLWEQFRIPQFHRAYFLQYNEKDLDAILRETADIKLKQSIVQKLMSLIKGRERCLNFLKTETFEEHKFSELLFHLRILTVNVIEQFKKWRDSLNRCVRWRIDEIDYLVQLRGDLDFLKEYYQDYQRDPFLLWLYKLGKYDTVHSNYHQLQKDMMKRIRDCEILLIENDYFDMQTNILSRKEAQLINKYLRESTIQMEDQLKSQELKTILSPNHKQTKTVQIQDNFTLVPQVVRNKEQFNNLLNQIKNDNDIDSSFPIRDNLFELIDYQDSLILALMQHQKIKGICISQSEQSEQYRKVIIEQIRLENLQLFPQFIQQLSNYLHGNEITIKLVHYMQNEKLIDCEYLKVALKQEGFRWKQQTNDSGRNIRYTIYYKKKEYQQQQMNQFKFNFHVHSTKLNQLMQLVYNNIDDSTNVAQKFKHYVDSRKSEHNPTQIKLKPKIYDDRVVLLDVKLKIPSFQTEVRYEYKYYRIIQDPEITNISFMEIDGQIVYALSLLDNDYYILISKDQICHEQIQISQFQPTEEDLSIPMFCYNDEIADVFNHHINLQFEHLMTIKRKVNTEKQSIEIAPDNFYFSIFYDGHVINSFKIKQHHLIKFKPFKSQINISDDIKIDKSKFMLQCLPLIQKNIESEPLKIMIKNHECICALDNYANSRKWIIYTIVGCQENQLKDVLEQLITQLTLIDPNIQEVGIDLYHEMVNGEFITNKNIQKQLTSLGFKWKIQVNEANEHTRFTKYLLKLQRETQVVDNIVIQYFCTQDFADVNVQPLIQQFSIFYQTLTQSQLVVKRNNLIPFSKYYNKDIPPELYTDQMLETRISQILQNCKYGTKNKIDYIIFNNQVITSNKHPELGTIYFIQLFDIVLCFYQLEKELNTEQIANLIQQSTSDENEQKECLGVEFIQYSKAGSNYSMEINFNMEKNITIETQNFKTISKPYFIGIIEPNWYDKHNQMIASMIIL